MQLKEKPTFDAFDDLDTNAGLKFSKNQVYLLAVLFAAALYFPVFYWLDKLPLSIFDEARIAVNAIELSWQKFWLTTYNGSPEMWSLKPPLLPWLQKLLMYVVGYNKLAIRLPSALAALGCCIMFLYFSRNIFINYLPGVSAGLVLVTSQGFIRDHVARNGDYDALLSFFILSAFLLFFIYIYTSGKKYLYLAGAALIGGLLTKGIAAVIFAPAILLFLVYEKKIWWLLKQKPFWQTALSVLAVMILYYMSRDISAPGYFAKVVEGEWKGIPMTVVQDHHGPRWYYIDYFFYTGFANYVLLLLVAFVAYIVLPKNTLLHKLAVYCLLFILVEGAVLSVAKSKLPWYDAPIYPVAALLTGVFIAHFTRLVSVNISKISSHIKPGIICVLLIVAVFCWPYLKTMQYILNEKPSSWSPLLYDGYMKKLRKNKPEIKNYTIAYAGNNEQLIFFGQAYNKQFGYNIGWKDVWKEFNEGDTIVSCEKFVSDTLATQFNYKLLHQNGDCKTYTLMDKK